MTTERILRFTVPLSPLLHPGEGQPRQLKRLRPVDSLNLRQLITDMAPSTLTTLSVNGGRWSVVSVFSPYSPDLHVMVMETSPDRYLPSPTWLDPQEGEALLPIWAAILQFLGDRPDAAKLCLGYNWSPRAWGNPEERGGFQSLPTKWHPMLWSWPSLPNEGEASKFADWVEVSSLPPPMRRLMGENDYAVPLGRLLRARIGNLLSDTIERPTYLDGSSWSVDSRGLQVSLAAGSLQGLLRREGFFADFLLPIATALEAVAKELTEVLTSMRFDEYDKILLRTQRGPLQKPELDLLRSVPQIALLTEVTEKWIDRGLPSELLDSLHPAVERRSREVGPAANWWRKGFGYALVLVEDRELGSVTLRVMPGVYVGPGGVVEAQGVLLRRPEDQRLETDELRRKSRVLWQLADSLEDRFPTG